MERQRLSRFDTLTFLGCPLVLLGITVLANAFLQYEAIRKISVLGVPLVSILALVSTFFVIGWVFEFAMFILAYAADNLKRRLLACRILIFFAGLLALQLVLVFAGPCVKELDAKGSSQVLWGQLPTLLSIAAGLTALYESGRQSMQLRWLGSLKGVFK